MHHMSQTETQLSVTRVQGVVFLYLLSAGLACVAWCVAAGIAALLIVNYFATTLPTSAAASAEAMSKAAAANWRLDRCDPFNLLPTHDAEIVALKKSLAADRTNAELQDAVRQRDLVLRDDYFLRRFYVHFWGNMLAFVAIIGLVATKVATTLVRTLPIPQPSQTPSQASAQARAAFTFGVAGLAVFVAAGVGVMVGALLVAPPIPFSYFVSCAETPPATSEIVSTATTSDDNAALPDDPTAWPSFRSASGSGVAATDATYPTTWDTTNGTGVVWELALSLDGNSSPILWGDHIFLTAADATKRVVIAADTSGKKLWETEVPSAVAAFKIDGDTGYAAPTPATDGVRVYAIFATGDLVACDMSGKIVWQESLGLPDSHYGYAASLAIHSGRVIVQYDVGDGANSKLLCFDGATGKKVWEVARKVPNSWASPIVARIAGRDQIITVGDPFVIAYAAEDGSEVWRCKALSGDVGPSPIAFDDKYVVVTNQSPRTTMIDATGTGDVTATHVIWSGSNMLPDTSSPLAVKVGERTFVLTLASSGYITCYQTDKVTDKKAAFWELELGDGLANFYSSPMAVGSLVYCFDMTKDGPHAYVVDLSKAETDDAGRLVSGSAAAMIVGVNPMREPCVASPILHAGRIYIRSAKTLWCIGEK
ncbi:MAG: PQQ-binding-like beta-propeller repeat protein [Thermoguttaceae bacterium]